MLTVYTYPTKAPKNCIDVSSLPLDELAQSLLAIFHHQKGVSIWFGYLDGWMLSPQEETLIRKVIRNFDCHAVSCFPISFSHAWKNEINTIYTVRPHGDSNTDNHGSSVYDGGKTRYKQTSQ